MAPTMKALRHHPHGLQIDTIPIPVPGAKEVLIKVHTTCPTRGELDWPESVDRAYPIPGHDVAGTVHSVGSAVTAFKVGDEVMGLISFSRQGAAAEYTIAAEEELALKPNGMGWEEAAAMPLSTLTVWQALFEHAEVKAGERVLITGAGGGVGVMLVQIAHWAKAHTSGTCSGAKAESVQSLGASEVYDYNKLSMDELPNDFDVVIDCVGGETLEKCFHRLKQAGRLISLVRPLHEEETAQPPDVMAKFFIVEPNGKQLEEIIKLWEQGIVKPVIQTVMPLEDGARAFEMLADGHTKGKIVLKVAS